jgi:hypothetical protein
LSVEAWIGIGGLLLTVIGAVLRMEQRMGKALTREEHERICMERNARVERQLEDLREEFQSKHEENRENFNKIETGITGTHRRLDDLYRDLIARADR